MKAMDHPNSPFGASGITRIRDVLNSVHFSVRAACGHCGHVSDLNWSALALSHSEEKSLRTLARSIRCKGCGFRGCEWRLTRTASPDESTDKVSPPGEITDNVPPNWGTAG